jgi:carbonic anhydrase/acetyltransferase-like protein (isoleucine patch superfamily)
MGSPGKIIRTVSPEEIAGFRASAHHYVETARRFLTQLSEGNA